MKNLRVGLFTYGMSNHLTGIGNYAMETAYALKRLALPLDLILLNPYPESPLSWYQDFECFSVPNLKRLPDVLVKGPKVLHEAAIKLNLDILHDPCGIAPFNLRREHYGRIVTIYDAIPVVHPNLQPFLTRLVFHTFVPAAKRSADAVITVSEHAKGDISKNIGIPKSLLHVIPPGTYFPPLSKLQEWYSELPEILQTHNVTPPYFLFVGSSSPRKNLPIIIRAFQQLRSRRPDVSFVMVGPQSPHVPTSADGLRHLGYASETLLDTLYVGASALVFPSLYEGFGMPILEAMARGTPVITSNTSSMPEAAGNAGILVDPNDTSAITEAMHRCLDRPTAMKHSLRGRLWARRFDWETAAWSTWRVYVKVAYPQEGLVV